ncbi:hypothetical protein JCM10213_000103 [Rhodosporidiobolus nylandii]
MTLPQASPSTTAPTSLSNGFSTSSSPSPNGPHKPADGPAFATRAIHVGSEPSLNQSGGVSTSLDLSTTYAQQGVGGLVSGFEYSRSSNPTRLALERLLASLEGADEGLKQELAREGVEDADAWVAQNGPAALAFASGSAATATVVQALVGNGGHIVSVGDVYGGTSRYMLKVAGPLQGATTDFVDLSYRAVEANGEVDANGEGDNEQAWRDRQDEAIVARLERAIRPETKVIWIETPTNPMLNLVPITLIPRVARARSIPLVVDNTFASPALQLPLSLGATIVIASSTKYVSGHSDVIGGYVSTSSPSLLAKLRFLQSAHGAIPSPFDCYLLIRSLKTLSLRVRQHSLNGLAVARYLHEVARPAGVVRDVRYPGLNRGEGEKPEEKRERELAWEQLAPEARKWVEKQGFTRSSAGGFPAGGMVTFHIASPFAASQEQTGAAERFLERLKVFTLAESLGGVESLAELPLKMTHGGVDPTRRAELGIDGELIRLSVGVEDVDDLLEDVRQALEAAKEVR